MALVKQVDKIYATAGKKIVFFDLKTEKPRKAELFKAICRNGKLRAPALRKGKTLLVGFDEDTYARVFR
jgi:arsenate reductase-like glutaredoxin family protein